MKVWICPIRLVLPYTFALANGQVHAVERPGRAGVVGETNIVQFDRDGVRGAVRIHGKSLS